MPYVAAYFAALVVFVVLDALWLGLFAGGVFRSVLGDLIRETPDLAAAAFFYLLYIVGVMGLAVAPAMRERSCVTAIWKGGLLGLIAYGTFELTSMAVLAGWSWRLVALDMTWGVVGTAIAAAVGYLAASRFGRRARDA